MRAALLCTLAALGIAAAATHIEGACLQGLLLSAQRWTERIQRVPALAAEVDHSSLSVGGGVKIARHTSRARVLETITIEGGPVVAIAEREGEVALGAFDGGAWKVSAGGEPRRLAVDARVNDLAFDDTGTLWAATAGGSYRVTAGGEAAKLAPGAFQAVAIWKGRAWFASPRGLSVAGAQGFVTRGKEQGFAADGPAALAACGTLLCVGALDGLWLFDGTRAQRLGSDTGALPSDWVTAVAAGSEGIWAGTFDAGLAQLSPAHRRFAPGDGLPEGRIQPHSLTVRDGATWAGTPAGIVELRDGSASLVSAGLPAAEVTALISSRVSGLWMGYQTGAARVAIEEVNP